MIRWCQTFVDHVADPTPYTALIQQVATTYRLPFALLQSQVIQESGGDPFAFRYERLFWGTYIKSNMAAKARAYGPLAACSFGLLQILMETAMERGFTGRPEELFDPLVGLTWGATHLRHLWDGLGGKADTYRPALARYNGIGSASNMYADQIFRRAGASDVDLL